MSISPSAEVRVLHVDDDPGFTELTTKFLERKDERISALSETDVYDALQLITENQISCVVSDYDMPEKDGLEFLRLVRDENSDLPFVLFTGKGSEEIASRAISEGVDDYIQKEPGTDQYTVLANRIITLVRARRAENVAKRTEQRYHNLSTTLHYRFFSSTRQNEPSM